MPGGRAGAIAAGNTSVKPPVFRPINIQPIRLGGFSAGQAQAAKAGTHSPQYVTPNPAYVTPLSGGIFDKNWSVGGGGGASAQSFGAVGSPTVHAQGVLNAGQQAIQDARKAAQRAQAQLKAQYERDKKELRAQFQFAETAEEKRMLARSLGELNRQRDEGLKAIAAGFATARSEIQTRHGQVMERTPQQAQAVGDLYRQGAEDVAGTAGRAAALAGVPGLGVNIDGGEIGAVNDLAALTAAAAPREQALEQRLGDIAGEDLAWLADTMMGESQAHQADLRRLSQSQIASTQLGHDQRVQDRIFQERMQHTNLLAGLQGDYRQRGFQLTDTDINLLTQLGQMQSQAAESAAARALQASQANASMRHASSMQAQQLGAQSAMQAQGINASAAQAAAQRNLQMRLAQMDHAQQQQALRAQQQGPQMPSPNSLAGGLMALDTFNTYGPSSLPLLQQHGFGGALAPVVQQQRAQSAQNLAGGIGNLFGSLGNSLLAPLMRR